MRKASVLFWAVLCVATHAAGVRAQNADPIDVPLGPGASPEAMRHLDTKERVERGAKSLRDRGYAEMPVLGLALLREAETTGDPAEARKLIARAVTFAPNTPSVHYAALFSPSRTVPQRW